MIDSNVKACSLPEVWRLAIAARVLLLRPLAIAAARPTRAAAAPLPISPAALAIAARVLAIACLAILHGAARLLAVAAGAARHAACAVLLAVAAAGDGHAAGGGLRPPELRLRRRGAVHVAWRRR